MPRDYTRTTTSADTMSPWIIPLIVVGTALVLVAVLVGVGVFLVKKRSAESQVSEPIPYYNSLSLV